MGPTVGLFGFLAQVNTARAEKLHACMVLDISNIRPLKVKKTALSKTACVSFLCLYLFLYILMSAECCFVKIFQKQNTDIQEGVTLQHIFVTPECIYMNISDAMQDAS